MASRLRTRLRASTGLATPSLNIELATAAGGLDPRVTFSRGTQATLTDSTGKITYAPNNLLTNSEDFEAVSWPKSACSVSSNATTAPNGTLTADKLAEDGTTAAHYLNRAGAVVNVPQIYSVYAKAAERTQIALQLGTNAAYFNLANGTVVSGGVGATITDAGNGWYRCAFLSTPSNANTQIYIAVNGGATYAGTAGNGIYIWGAQLEQVTYQTTPGTYNSTTPKNLLGYTQEFDNAAWTKSNSFVQTNLAVPSNGSTGGIGVTATANSAVSPSGQFDAITFTKSDATTPRYSVINTIATIASTTTYTASAYFKYNGYDTIVSLEYNNTVNWGIGWSAGFTVTASEVTANTPNLCTSTVTPVGNGWYRCTATFTTTTVTTPTNPAILTRITGATGASVLFYGAQLVQGATAGDYQPTYAAAAAVQYAAPDGTLSADKLVETATNTTHRTFGAVTTTAVSYAYSVYLKAAERTWAYLRIDRNGGTNPQAWFDLSNGAVGTVQTGLTASIQSVGNGWYRCAVIVDAALAGTANPLVGVATANAVDTYTGDGTSGIYVWGAQLSNSASLDPYVYNPSAAPTSAAYYGPRFDYDPATLQPRGILIEEQRTNAVTYSAQFENVAWVKNNAQIVPDIDPAAATLGPELCINGDFASGTGWTANTGWVISGGQATATATSTSMYGGQMTTVAGRVYRIDFDIVSYTSGDLLVTIGQNYDGPVRFTSPSATRRTAYVVSGTNTTRGVEFYGGTVTCAIDNVSVREVIGGALQAPDGTFTADTLLAVNTTSAGLVRSFASTAVAYTFSVYLKQGNTSFSEIEIIDQGTIANRVRLTYATGALTVVSGSPTGTATSVGNGWWRVTITYTFPAIGAADTLVVYPSTTTGTIGQYCFAWGAQLEAGAFATSYIPTVASTVTRSADVASMLGTNFASWFNGVEGTVVASFDTFAPVSANPLVFSLNDNTTSNRIDIFNGGSAPTYTRAYVATGGVAQAQMDTAAAITSGKAAIAYAANNFAACAAGATVITDTSGTVPTVNQLQLGRITNAIWLNGHIQSIQYYPTRLTNTQLQVLTT